MWQLYRGPISAPFLKPYIIAALNQDIENTDVSVESVNIELVRSIKPIKIIANNLEIKEKDETFSLKAPKVSLSFSIKALLHGIIAPSSVDVTNLSAYIFTSYGVDDNDKAADITTKKLGFYINQTEEFFEKFNSSDNTYPESYINDITISGGQFELHEVELGRKWIVGDFNYKFERTFSSITTEVNGFLNLHDKLITIGAEAEYRQFSNKLALQVYFSDLVPADLIDNILDNEKNKNFYRINLPISGRIITMVDFNKFIDNSGSAIKAIDKSIEKVNFQFEGGNGNILFSADDNLSKYDISSFVLDGEVTGPLDKISIKNADFNLGEQKVKLGFELSGLGKYFFEDDKKHLKADVTADIKSLKMDDLYTYWPRYIAADAWEWCKDSIFGGYAKNAHFKFEFAYDEIKKALAFKNISGGAYLDNSNLRYINTMPIVNNVYGDFKVFNTSLEISLDKATSDGIMLNSGLVRIYDLDKYNNYITIKLDANSPISAALKLIDHEPLMFTSEMGIKPDTMQGEAETKLELNFELKKDLGYEEVKVVVESSLKNVTILDAINSKPLKAEHLQLAVNNDGMEISGDASYEGVPLKVVWNEKFNPKKGYRSRYLASFKIDPAVAKTLGADYEMLAPPYFDGFAMVDALATINKDKKLTVDISASLKDAAMNYGFLGFVKSVGEKADFKASLNFAKNRLVEVPSFMINKQGFELAGKVEMYGTGSLRLVDINNIKGPKTRAKARIEIPQNKSGEIKVNISGNSYDLSEFFEKSGSASASTSDKDPWEELEKAPNALINIAVNTLWTNPDVSVTNFAGTAKLVNGVGMHEMHLIGNYDNNSKMNLKLDYTPRPGNEFLLAISSNHAGNTLKFLRIYENMRGGNLQIDGKRDKNKVLIGHAKIRDFSLHNTPTLAKLLSLASFRGMVDLLRGEGITFSHFDAPFRYKNKQIVVKEGKAYGNVLGISFTGAYNLGSESTSIEGMFAPAYGLNTMIGRLPIVGGLLAGKDGTVFAANYSILGTASAPEVTLNPLSALSPNSLKEAVSSIFGSKQEY